MRRFSGVCPWEQHDQQGHRGRQHPAPPSPPASSPERVRGRSRTAPHPQAAASARRADLGRRGHSWLRLAHCPLRGPRPARRVLPSFLSPTRVRTGERPRFEFTVRTAQRTISTAPRNHILASTRGPGSGPDKLKHRLFVHGGGAMFHIVRRFEDLRAAFAADAADGSRLPHARPTPTSTRMNCGAADAEHGQVARRRR